MAVTLTDDILACEGLGAFSVLFRAGETLPAEATFRATFSTLPAANNSVSLFSGKRPLGAVLYRSATRANEGASDLVDVRVAVDEAGCFFADARSVATSLPFLAFCVTLELPGIEGAGDKEVSESDAPPVGASRQRVEDELAAEHADTTLGCYLGFENDNGELEILLAPDDEVPAEVRFCPPGDVPQSTKILAICPSDLCDFEEHLLTREGVVPLIEDDATSLLLFRVDIGRSEWVLKVDSTLRLAVCALEENQEHRATYGGDDSDLNLSYLVNNNFTADRIRRLRDARSRRVGAVAAVNLTASGKAHESVAPPPPVAEVFTDRDVTTVEAQDLEVQGTDDDQPAEGRDTEGTDPRRGRHLGSSLFISHNTDTDGEFALSLVAHLEEVGVDCWIAARDIRAGTNWNRAIMTAVHECAAMVVVVTPASIESEYVQAEVQLALKLKKPVVPLLVESGLSYTDIDARLETRQRVEWHRVGLRGVTKLKRILLRD